METTFSSIASLLKMETSLKEKNLLPEGANSFLYEQFLIVWKITFITLSDPAWMLLFFITHLRYLRNGCYANDTAKYFLQWTELWFVRININSIRGKPLELLTFLDVHQPHVVAIQETKNDSSIVDFTGLPYFSWTFVTWLPQPINICPVTTRPSSHILKPSIKIQKEILFGK